MDYSILYAAANIQLLEEKIFKNADKLGSSYNRFQDIDNVQKNKIVELSKSFYNSVSGNLMAQNYTNILNYLSTSNGKCKLCDTREITGCYNPTYDEYLVFAISSCDPECKMFTSYLKCNSKLNHDRKKNIVRKELGFFSEVLFKAEKDYYFKYINDLICDVTIDNSSYLSLISSTPSSFDDVSTERFDQISKLALLWNASVNEEHKYTTCLYNLIYQYKLLGINSLEEKLLFFVCAVDPELKLLSIYDEESKTNIMILRSLDEVGFYNPNLIKIEKTINKKFMPQKIVSEWSL